MSDRVPHPVSRQSGVTLVEVLVSMVIMALGLVSLAALQNVTLRYQLGSVHRAQLSGLLSDYAERVRSNLAQAPADAGGSATGTNYLYSADWDAQSSAPAAVTPDCKDSSDCTAPQLAAADMAQWRARVRSELPRGSVLVSGDAVRGLLVTFMWSDKEYVASATGDLRLADTCAEADVGLAEQACCPKGADAPEGVRCATFSIIP